jgi:hypothetical protein
MGLCPLMSKPITVSNMHGAPIAKLIEVECKRSGCEWWYYIPPSCTVSYDCPECDTGPCGPSCTKAKWSTPGGHCKAVTYG